MYLLPVCIQLNRTCEDCCCCCTYEHCGGRCCCTYDLQHILWLLLLLLLLLIVDQLVYHTVLLLCHIYRTQLMRLYDEHNMLEVFRFFFFSSDLHQYCMYGDCGLLLYVNMSTYEGRCCCTYDL